MLRRAFPFAILALAAPAQAQTTVAKNGRPQTSIFVATSATEPEKHAAHELARWLGEMTVAKIPVTTDDTTENAILIGTSAATKKYFPTVPWASLRNEQTIYQVRGQRTLLTGGGTRGALYAVYRLLHSLGVRWWTPWATGVPKKSTLVLPNRDLTETPAFESRDPFWFHAFDGDWAARNYSNSQHARLEGKHGGKVQYQGFVHTFYALVPPAEQFGPHPEWFSLINGQRTTANAQLCTTNPQLRDFIVAKVKADLRANPSASIVSVSQNDCYNPCQCPVCQALAREQGSESAPVLALANYVAEKIEGEFPNVAVDTLAYQYTRKAPKTMRPRHNVIVRLCSIECSFAQPLDSVTNKTFADDVKDWARLTNRLYIWNYTTNFHNYPQPLPNYFIIGENQRFFLANGVKGLFEQGAYQSSGSDLPELRAWLQAQLLWNPRQDDKALIDEFLRGYYGTAAAKPIRQYLKLIADAAKGDYATIYDPPTKSFFRFEIMHKTELLWQEAEKLTAQNPEMLWRVKQNHLSVLYVFLNRWSSFRSEAIKTKTPWPLPTSRWTVADRWVAQATGPGPAGWTPMTAVNEGSLSPKAWFERFRTDPPEPVALPARPATAPLPTSLDLTGKTVLDAQDNLANLWNEPDGADLRPDQAASDGIAARMPGSHHEWAFQIPVKNIKGFVPGRYRVIVIARVEHTVTGGTVFSAGAWDSKAAGDTTQSSFAARPTSKSYDAYEVGVRSLSDTSFIWAAPPNRAEVQSIWIDRVLLIKE